jgi:hypothetical protein
VYSAYVLTDRPQVIHKSYTPMGKDFGVKKRPVQTQVYSSDAGFD